MGHLVVTLPTGALLVGPFLLVLVANQRLEATPVLAAVAGGLALAWCYRMFAAPRWRAWAYRSVPVADFGVLRVKAHWAGLAWPEGHLLERGEWKSARQVRKERALEAEYLGSHERWPDTPSYEEPPEKKLRAGVSVILVLVVVVLVWRWLSPVYFTEVKPNSMLLFVSAVGVLAGIMTRRSSVAVQAFPRYRRPIGASLVFVGAWGLGLVHYDVIMDGGLYLPGVALVPIVIALLGLKK